MTRGCSCEKLRFVVVPNLQEGKELVIICALKKEIVLVAEFFQKMQ